MTDNEILMWYMKGWRSEGACPAGGIEKIAYQRGRTDYYVGDSIPSIDNKPKEVLIAEVKEEFESKKNHTPVNATEKLLKHCKDMLEFFTNYPPCFADGKSMETDIGETLTGIENSVKEVEESNHYIDLVKKAYQ